MIIIREKCCICNGNIKYVNTFENYPIKFTMTKDNNYEYNKFKFYKCNNCNTFQLKELIPLKTLYSDAHNNEVIGKTWMNHFKNFTEFINSNCNNLKIVLEIGGPTDKIVKYINNYEKWFLVDPNAKKYNNDKINCICEFFDESFKIDCEINTIIHSHLLEHLYNPNDLLSHMNNILCNDGDMFISVPNMSYYSQTNVPFLGIHFEHTYFLNEANIIYLFNNNNFTIINKQYFNNHSIFYHVKKNISNNNILSIDLIRQYNSYLIHLFNEKIIYFKDLVKSINKQISDKDSVYLFGCHTNSQMLVYFNLNIKNIIYILDNDLSKHNKYFYGTPLICKSPNILKDIDTPKVICYIGIYSNEVREQLKNINNSIIFL